MTTAFIPQLLNALSAMTIKSVGMTAVQTSLGGSHSKQFSQVISKSFIFLSRIVPLLMILSFIFPHQEKEEEKEE